MALHNLTLAHALQSEFVGDLNPVSRSASEVFEDHVDREFGFCNSTRAYNQMRTFDIDVSAKLACGGLMMVHPRRPANTAAPALRAIVTPNVRRI